MTSKIGRPRSKRDAKTVTLTVTPEAWEMLYIHAQKLGTTRSELVEKLARGEIYQDHPHFGEIFGGTISQLILKAENQLAMLENSADETKEYISELKRLQKYIEKSEGKQ